LVEVLERTPAVTGHRLEGVLGMIAFSDWRASQLFSIEQQGWAVLVYHKSERDPDDQRRRRTDE